jgi:hypothetical protein
MKATEINGSKVWCNGKTNDWECTREASHLIEGYTNGPVNVPVCSQCASVLENECGAKSKRIGYLEGMKEAGR